MMFWRFTLSQCYWWNPQPDLQCNMLVIFAASLCHSWHWNLLCHFSSENNDEKNSTTAKNRILASSCSESGKYLALCDDLKQLHLYKFDEQWNFLNLRYVHVTCRYSAFIFAYSFFHTMHIFGNLFNFSLMIYHSVDVLSIIAA